MILYGASLAFAVTAWAWDASPARAEIVASDPFEYPAGKLLVERGGRGFQSGGRGWKSSDRHTARVVATGLEATLAGKQFGSGGAIQIRGFDDRDNPLRRQLQQAYTGDELFVRFLIRYDADSIDVATGKKDSPDEGEFFVLWLDDIDGSDGAVHNTNVPNIGLHVATRGAGKGKNRFMVRIGSRNQAFTDVDVTGDRTYIVVGRLAKSIGGPRNAYDTFQIWIDPKPEERDRPLATSRNRRGINLVQWVGFATGRKTEPADRIVVDELVLGSTWESVLGLPEETKPTQPRPASTAGVDFRRDVYPLLKQRCFECHAGRDADSGVRLDVLEEVLGHTTGNALAVAGKSKSSPLVKRVTAETEDERMPPEGDRLDEKQIAILKAWIDQGVAWDAGLLPSPAIETDHWAFQVIERPPVPKVRDADWVRNPIDAFVAAGHEKQKLQPSPQASPVALARRLCFGLTGLPPKPEGAERLSSGDFEKAYDALVEQYLASPQYGERWARHWLDVARWGESNGYQHNRQRHHAWRYRDYVVRSFNDDKPYVQFLREQIAGDELNPRDDDHLIATGFLAAARVSANQMNREIQRNDILVDMVNATGESILGLTLGCAQCHNHKFDPITARDYYRFKAFFVKGQLGNLVLEQASKTTRAGKEKKESGLPQTFGFYAPSTSPAPVTRLRMRDIKYPLPYQPAHLAQAKTHLLIRGEVDNLGPVVQPGWPAVFGRIANQQKVNERPRTALVRWLTSRENPLTARVWVNRIWHYHFGRGLVEQTSDFGVRTPKPAHHRLLDWLAAELMENAWSTKHIQRLIVSSNTYRQAAKYRPDAAKIDPDNQWLWRYTPRRLEAEAIRDAVLAVSGELDLTRGGPSVRPDSAAGRVRRTLYLLQKRQDLPEVQDLFDGASAVVSCGKRRTSTVPLQPLYLLNSAFMVQRAKAFAKRVEALAPGDPQDQIEQAFRMALGRRPDEQERQRAAAFLQPTPASGAHFSAADADQRLVHFCHALLNLNEFIYIH